jgi:hypothetical protein
MNGAAVVSALLVLAACWHSSHAAECEPQFSQHSWCSFVQHLAQPPCLTATSSTGGCAASPDPRQLCQHETRTE